MDRAFGTRFMKPMYAYDPFNQICPYLTFVGSRGETCLRLTPDWPGFLTELHELGPLLVGMRSGPFTGVSHCCGVEFIPVPESSEVVEVHSGWVLDTAQIAAVIAVREALPCPLLGLQFFDASGEGIFKLILRADSHLDAYADLITRGASAGGILQPLGVAAPTHPKNHFLYDSTAAVSHHRLVKSLLLAYQYKFALRFTLRSHALHRDTSVRLCRFERAVDDILICDCLNEICLGGISKLLPSPYQARPNAPVSLIMPMHKSATLEVGLADPTSVPALWEALHAQRSL